MNQENKTGNYELHPEWVRLSRIEYEGIITIRFESGKISKARNEAERDGFIRTLMGICRKHWKLRKNEFCWFSSTEYGEGDNAHCHLLISFEPLRRLDQWGEIPKLSSFFSDLQSMKDFACEKENQNSSAVNIHWKSACESEGLTKYVCKIEKNQNGYKHFLFSKNIIKEINRLCEQI